jgi:ABC-type multidrug transport system ATPase subunit
MAGAEGRGVTPSAVLVARDLQRDYGDLTALSGVDLAMKSGEMVALVGPNGAGKSTLLALAAGLLTPSAGMVHVMGKPAGSLEARAATSFLPDAPSLYDDLSLEEHLEYVGRLHGVEDWDERGSSLLDRLGLASRAGDLPAKFSRGMRQKSSIALAFVRDFSLLLADEPFDGLDPDSRQAFAGLIDDAVAGGAAVLVSTHRVDVVERATRCVALYDGSVSYDGPPDAAELASPPG